MSKCAKCNKDFRYDSDYNRHTNRKTPCDLKNEELECKSCKVNFKCNTEKLRHEKTNKHIENHNKFNHELNDKITDTELIKIQNENNSFKLEIKNLKDENNSLNEENNSLKLEIKNLKEENNLLKQNSKTHPNNEFIYITHCAQYINTNIYKIGQTKNIMNRFRQYPKGSEMLFMFSCNNAKHMESKILKYLKLNNNNIWYKDAGNEYFQCDINNLKSDIYNILNS